MKLLVSLLKKIDYQIFNHKISTLVVNITDSQTNQHVIHILKSKTNICIYIKFC
jgi:hypothetical protein